MKLIILLVLFCGISWCSILIDDVRSKVIDEIDNGWKELKTIQRKQSNEKSMKELGQLLKNIPQIIHRIEHELMIGEYEEVLRSIGTTIKNGSEWKDKWTEITILTSPIDVIYGYFKVFPDMPDAFIPGSDVMDFDAFTITDLILKPLYTIEQKGTNTLTYLSEHAHSAVISKSGHNLFTILRHIIEKSQIKENWCPSNAKTPQQIIYGLYNILLLKDIKEYTIINFAWMLQYIINGTTQFDLQSTTQTLRIQAIEKQTVAKSAIGLASNILYKCDPENYIEGHNYEQFKELLQGYIENEGKMHPKGSCKQNCDDFTFIKSRCSYPDDESCFKHRVCTGDIVECKYVAADATACLANPPRRFDYIDYKRGPLLGKSQSCSGEIVRRDSYWRFLYHCSNCLCLCDDPNSPTTIRHISLDAVTSNVYSNQVVTGIRFVMKDKVLHIQIEEGTPIKNGQILEGSTQWKEIRKLTTKNGELVMQLDYLNRAFDLDDIQVPPSYVVTGVKFRHLGGHINMEVQATQLNPITIELIQSSSHWLSNDNTPESNNPRNKLNLDESDIPILSPIKSKIDSLHDQYIEFETTSRLKDVAQTTIPFIDTQIIRPNPPIWLNGIGIYHKGYTGYGGFLALRVFTKNLVEFVENEENEN